MEHILKVSPRRVPFNRQTTFAGAHFNCHRPTMNFLAIPINPNKETNVMTTGVPL
jgi:hypothetical protein